VTTLCVRCSDTAYLDYIGLFLKGKRTNLRASAREPIDPDDILLRSYVAGQGNNKLY